jgi:hypothetical protein
VCERKREICSEGSSVVLTLKKKDFCKNKKTNKNVCKFCKGGIQELLFAVSKAWVHIIEGKFRDKAKLFDVLSSGHK